VTTLVELAREAASCTCCDLHQRATATVFGEGRPDSPLALVGEQPGDQEDKQGHPFVGPAGHVLDRALEAFAGFVVNLVKSRESLTA
jgi:DNA polymerase